jgi:hypothetical protein
MKATSVKRAFGLAAAAVSTSGAMMLAPAMANAATAHPAHAQTVTTVSNVSKTIDGSWGHHSNYRHPPGRYYYHGRYYNHRYYRHGRYMYR